MKQKLGSLIYFIATLAVLSVMLAFQPANEYLSLFRSANKYLYRGGGHEMTMYFKINGAGSKVNVYYVDVLDGGKYINESGEDDPYSSPAGVFDLSAIKNGMVTFKVKNYRVENDFYSLTLTFQGKSKIAWYINNKPPIAFLPQAALFMLRRN